MQAELDERLRMGVRAVAQESAGQSRGGRDVIFALRSNVTLELLHNLMKARSMT